MKLNPIARSLILASAMPARAEERHRRPSKFPEDSRPSFKGKPGEGNPFKNSTIGSRPSAQPEDPEPIVGGTPLEPGDRPYLAYLSFGCGGSLIAPRVVLSAARESLHAVLVVGFVTFRTAFS